MRKLGVCLAFTGAVAVWLTGCGSQFGGQPAGSRGGIAVVDLDKVAAETGKAIEMKEGLQIQENGLKQRLVQLKTQAQGILEAKANDLKIKDLGDDIPENVRRELQQVQVKLNNDLVKAQNDAGRLLAGYQQNQLTKFRTELKPILHDTAAKRGLSVVIPKNDGLLLTVDPGVDITDDVIKAYSAKRPAPTATPAPASVPVPGAASSPAATQAAKPQKDRAAVREARENRESDGEARN